MRERWRSLSFVGVVWLVAGIFVFIDALDGALLFPISLFASLLVVEGICTLLAASVGVGGQRVLRQVKALAVLVVAGLIFAGAHEGNFILSMLFGALFLLDGALQCASAYVVRFRRWRAVATGGALEMVLAVFFFQPYPTHYVGTLAFAVGLFLAFGGIQLIVLSARVRRLVAIPVSDPAGDIASLDPEQSPAPSKPAGREEWDGPPAADEPALTVHVWTPTGSSKAEPLHRPLIDRYIAAVDINGVISTGHAAMESPEGIYISLYPGIEIDRSPDEFSRTLRATAENDIPGVFQPDYPTESKAWCPSTTQVRIRNYDAQKLAAHWARYRQDTHYNLTHRNCSSSVSSALEAALEGAVGRYRFGRTGWGIFVRLVATPELWVASQIRRRALTMAWTPGLTLDYARALSMLADPRPIGIVRWFRTRSAQRGT